MTATAEKAKSNGTVTHDEFPVESFASAAPHLRRPFTPAAVKFKVQATWPKDNPTGGLVVAYIDARLVVERLNLVCPHLWADFYEPANGGLLCRLTVDGITRTDIGEGQVKGLYSDALKRAAVKFGVGVSLYAIPQSFISTEDGTAKQKRTSKGLTLELTPKGDQQIRAAYTRWLNEHGTKAFGEPLDHGDVEGAAGDPEEQMDAEPARRTVTAEPPKATEKLATSKQRGLLNAKAAEKGLSPETYANLIVAAAEQPVREFGGPEEALSFVNRSLDRLPARLVDPVLAGIEQTDPEDIPA